MTGGLSQQARVLASVEAEMRHFPRVSKPVDITDAEQFPEIARAIEHARRLRGEA